MKTNLDILIWGIRHIAANHGFDASVNYEEDGSVCIRGGCNIPTLFDVEMLCEDVKLPTGCIECSELGIDVALPFEWCEEYGREPYEEGLEMWKRPDADFS